VKTFDDAVLTKAAKTWLGQHNAMPSTWNLDEQELQRWLQAGVRISIFNSPACNIPVDTRQVAPSPQLQLALVDAYRIDGWVTEHGFTREELIATILHEIGHAVNRPEYRMESDEFWADDYSRHCGYEDHLRSALEKLIKLDPLRCTEDAFRPRLQRIMDKRPVKRAWLGDL
jgi:hypothetical protein